MKDFLIKKILKKIKKARKCKISYAQSGEDMIVNHVFQALRIKNPSYLDIGAHHPFHFSNTAFFYDKGSRGINIEPDPALFSDIAKQRKNDICLNVGVSTNSVKSADFYIMTTPTLNTFSREEAERCAKYDKGQKIEKVVSVPLVSINEIIEKHCKDTPNFVSLDVEGLDFEILKSIDLVKFRPEVFCIETMDYTESAETSAEMVSYMLANGYMNYANTYINTIFVDENKWRNKLV